MYMFIRRRRASGIAVCRLSFARARVRGFRPTWNTWIGCEAAPQRSNKRPCCGGRHALIDLAYYCGLRQDGHPSTQVIPGRSSSSGTIVCMEQPRTPSPLLGKLGWLECVRVASTDLVVETAQMQGCRNAVVGARVRGCAMLCQERIHPPKPEAPPPTRQQQPQPTPTVREDHSFDVDFRVDHRVATKDAGMIRC